MAASSFIEVTDEEINCFIVNAYFSKNHLCNYTKTVSFTLGSENIGYYYMALSHEDWELQNSRI